MNVLGKGSKQGFLLMRHILEKKIQKGKSRYFFSKDNCYSKKARVIAVKYISKLDWLFTVLSQIPSSLNRSIFSNVQNKQYSSFLNKLSYI